MTLFETFSGLAVRHLPRGQLSKLRNLYIAGRRRLHPLIRWAYGTFTAADLEAHLRARIGTDFEILMVHSSVDHMRPMYTEGPLELVRMLMRLCGSERTLAMPAFYFGDPAIGGAYPTFQQRPTFDLRRTPSQMGLATELFRRTKGVVYSRHPVYRVAAIGPLADELTRGHEQADTPAGRGTPFDVMTQHKTLILGIGKPFEVLTQVHHAEDVMGTAFPVPRHPPQPALAMTLIDGEARIPFALPAGGGLKWRRNMWKLRAILDHDQLREWRFHHVPLFATMAETVTEGLVKAAERGITLYEDR